MIQIAAYTMFDITKYYRMPKTNAMLKPKWFARFTKPIKDILKYWW